MFTTIMTSNVKIFSIAGFNYKKYLDKLTFIVEEMQQKGLSNIFQ